jgi:hypothetical protein
MWTWTLSWREVGGVVLLPAVEEGILEEVLLDGAEGD